MQEQELYEFHKRYEKDYEKEILPEVKELEQTRKQKKLFALICSICINFTAIALIIFLGRPHLQNIFIFIISAVILILIAQIPTLFIKTNFQTKAQKKLDSIIIPFKNIELIKKSEISSTELDSSGIVENDYIDRFDLKNYIGDYKSTKVAISETTMIDDTDCTFNGVLIKIAPTCEYSGKTVVVPPTTKISTLQEINQSDFENEYKIYSTSEIDAEEIISPTFLNALNNLKKVYNGTNIKGTIQGCEIFISISYPLKQTKNISLNSPIDPEPMYKELYEKLDCIFKLVNEVNIP